MAKVELKGCLKRVRSGLKRPTWRLAQSDQQDTTHRQVQEAITVTRQYFIVHPQPPVSQHPSLSTRQNSAGVQRTVKISQRVNCKGRLLVGKFANSSYQSLPFSYPYFTCRVQRFCSLDGLIPQTGRLDHPHTLCKQPLKLLSANRHLMDY